MSSKLSDTEFALWQETAPEHRSFLIEVLHWFHYRPSALKRSWAREEALTWELIRALEILPQSLFLRPFLHELASLSTQTRKALTPILAAREITITRYPSLKLAGAKRNCRSDIGFGLGEAATIWIEAKTAPYKDVDLTAQLLQQQKALARIFPHTPTAIITLLPWGRTLPGIANVAWSRLAQLLQDGVEELRSAFPSDEYRAGYEHLAVEIIGRIRSHPNKIVDNFVSPNNSLHRTHPRAPRFARRPAVRR